MKKQCLNNINTIKEFIRVKIIPVNVCIICMLCFLFPSVNTYANNKTEYYVIDTITSSIDHNLMCTYNDSGFLEKMSGKTVYGASDWIYLYEYDNNHNINHYKCYDVENNKKREDLNFLYDTNDRIVSVNGVKYEILIGEYFDVDLNFKYKQGEIIVYNKSEDYSDLPYESKIKIQYGKGREILKEVATGYFDREADNEFDENGYLIGFNAGLMSERDKTEWTIDSVGNVVAAKSTFRNIEDNGYMPAIYSEIKYKKIMVDASDIEKLDQQKKEILATIAGNSIPGTGIYSNCVYY